MEKNVDIQECDFKLVSPQEARNYISDKSLKEKYKIAYLLDCIDDYEKFITNDYVPNSDITRVSVSISLDAHKANKKDIFDMINDIEKVIESNNYFDKSNIDINFSLEQLPF